MNENNFVMSILKKQTDRQKKSLLMLSLFCLAVILGAAAFSFISNDIEKAAAILFLAIVVVFIFLIIDIIFLFVYLGSVKKSRNYSLLKTYGKSMPLEALVLGLNNEYNEGKLIATLELGTKNTSDTLFLFPTYLLQENLNATAIYIRDVCAVSMYQQTETVSVLVGNKWRNVKDTWNVVRLWLDGKEHDFYFKKNDTEKAANLFNQLISTYNFSIKDYEPKS